MIRLNLVVEGQTEETFVRDVLAAHLAHFQVFATARCLTTTRGGFVNYEHLRRDLRLWMRQERRNDGVWFSTMVDFYALPTNFPGLPSPASGAGRAYDRVEALEQALADDIAEPRFIPYIQLHEFEALVLCRPAALAQAFLEERDRAPISRLVALRESVDSSELIDDGPETAPSKRIIAELPPYNGRKTIVGPLVVEHIGLDTLRAGCPHFGAWLTRLESLGTSTVTET